MRRWVVPCGLWLVLAGVSAFGAGESSLITNPLADFLARKPHDDGSLLVLQADLTGDGQNQTFYSWSTDVDGKAGNIWTAYSPANGYYACYEDACIFRSDAMYAGQAQNLKGPALLTYFPASATSGALRGYQYDGVSFREIPQVTIAPMGKDAGLYKKLFEGGQGPQVKEYSWQQVQRMLQVSHAGTAALVSSEADGSVARPGQEAPVAQSPLSPTAGHSASSALAGSYSVICAALVMAAIILGFLIRNRKNPAR